MILIIGIVFRLFFCGASNALLDNLAMAKPYDMHGCCLSYLLITALFTPLLGGAQSPLKNKLALLACQIERGWWLLGFSGWWRKDIQL